MSRRIDNTSDLQIVQEEVEDLAIVVGDPSSDNVDNEIVRRDANGLISVSTVYNDTLLILDAPSVQCATVPINANDIVNKDYIDNNPSGRVVRLKTIFPLDAYTASGTQDQRIYTADVNGALTIDDISVVDGDRILLDQNITDPADAGIFVVNHAGSVSTRWELQRATDANSNGKVTSGMSVFVLEGTISNSKQYFLNTASPIVLGTTPLNFILDGAATSSNVANTFVMRGPSGHCSLGGLTVIDVVHADSLVLDSGSIASSGHLSLSCPINSRVEIVGQVGQTYYPILLDPYVNTITFNDAFIPGVISGDNDLQLTSAGQVTCTQTPSGSGSIVNKAYADALGTNLADISTIARRDANADCSFHAITTQIIKAPNTIGLGAVTFETTESGLQLTDPNNANTVIGINPTDSTLTFYQNANILTDPFTGNGDLSITAAGLLTLSSTNNSVQCSQSPAAGNDIVNKTYADALGTDSADASTIARRDVNADCSFHDTIVNSIKFTGGSTMLKSTNKGLICGIGAGSNIIGLSVGNGTYMGRNAGTSVTTGNYNVIIGDSASSNGSAITGSGNTVCGTSAAFNLGGVASDNTAYGYLALSTCTTGSSNVSIGTNSLANTTAAINRCVAVGRNAGYNNIANDIVAIGYESASSGSTSTCAQNITIGNNSLQTNVNGGHNVIIGHNAGINYAPVLTTCNNVIIGDESAVTLTTGTNNTLIGAGADVSGASITNSSAIGYNAVATQNNQIMLGNGSVTSVYTTATITAAALESVGSTLTIAGQNTTSTIEMGTGSGVQTVNIGTGSGVTAINLGAAGDTVNIAGTLTYVNTTNLNVTDSLITLNNSGAAGSAGGSGIQIEENAIITGYIKQNAGRTAWLMRGSANGSDFTINQSLATTDSPTFSTVTANLTGTASNVTTNANLTGEVTSVGNAATLTNSAVIGKVLTGFVSGAGTIAATDSLLTFANKIVGNLGSPTDANTADQIVKRDTSGNFSAGTITASLTGNASTVTTNANLTGEVTSVGNAATLTNSAVIGKVLTGFVSGAGTIAATDSLLTFANKIVGNLGSPTDANTADQIVKRDASGNFSAGTITASLNGNSSTVTTNANLTGEVTSVGNAATLTNSAVIGKVLTGFVSGAGTVAATDSILQAVQKVDGNVLSAVSTATALKLCIRDSNADCSFNDVTINRLKQTGGSVILDTLTSTNNTFVGLSANQTTTTTSSTFIGSAAGSAITSGVQNIGIGHSALAACTTSANNTAIGYQSMLTTSITAANNAAVGNSSLRLLTTGLNNSAFGLESLRTITTESNSTGAGYRAGYLCLGSQNTFLGSTADNSLGTSISNSMALGYNANVTASNTVQIGNSSVTSILANTTCDLGSSTVPMKNMYCNLIKGNSLFSMVNGPIVTGSATASQLVNGCFIYTGGIITITMPTGTQISAAFPYTPATNDSFKIYLKTVAPSSQITLSQNTGLQNGITGGDLVHIHANAPNILRVVVFRCTGVNTWDMY